MCKELYSNIFGQKQKFHSFSAYFVFLAVVSFFNLKLTPYKAEQPLWSMVLQEKEAQKD